MPKGIVAYLTIVSVLLCLTATAARSQQTPANSPFKTEVTPFLDSYCAGCHGQAKQKGDRRFDQLPQQIDGDETLVDFQDMLDQLNLGAMPPEESRQPSDDQRQRVIEILTEQIQAYHLSNRGASERTVLRRLNAREYRHAIRDLFDLNMIMFDPTVGFPRDQSVEHLDNIGDTLVTSSHQLSSYLKGADLTVEKAMSILQQTETRTWHFDDGFRQQPEVDQVHRKTNDYEYITLYEVTGADKHEGAYGHIANFADGVPADGYYDITVQAESLNRLHPYAQELLGTNRDAKLRLGIVAGNHQAGPLHKPQPLEPKLAELDLEDGTHTYTMRVWLDRGFTPRFTYPNGTIDVRNLWGKVVKRYKNQFPKQQKGGIVEHRFYAIAHGKFPQIRIHDVKIEGPIRAADPSPTLDRLFGQLREQVLRAPESLTIAQTRALLSRFASRAYRRPAADDEIERVMAVVNRQRIEGRTPIEAYGDGLKTILCSPNFLYLDSSVSDDNVLTPYALTPYALATRLSFFLWASVPDDRLMDVAADRSLLAPETLRAEVERMLSDERADDFIRGFVNSWLTLSDLGSTPPDRQEFNDFYQYDLGSAMRRETELFVRTVLDENRPIGEFLDSDYTYVNEALAGLYGLPFSGGTGFEKVTLGDGRRGGLLGQASILTVTANGIETSPVVRGVWILNNLLGTPSSPPPPDVEPLDPDVRGAKSIRDQLKKHRTIASCNECHRKIDPLGFALENYDAIGRWRDSYGRRAAIDSSGELPGGREFVNIAEFKQHIVGQQQQFNKALTRKLLEYSLGRKLGPKDRPQIDELVDAYKKGDGFRDLIHSIVACDAFRTR